MTIDGRDHGLNIYIPQYRMPSGPIQLDCIKCPYPNYGLAAFLIEKVKQAGRGLAIQPALFSGIKLIDVQVRRGTRAASGNILGKSQELSLGRYKMRQKGTNLPGGFFI